MLLVHVLTDFTFSLHISQKERRVWSKCRYFSAGQFVTEPHRGTEPWTEQSLKAVLF